MTRRSATLMFVTALCVLWAVTLLAPSTIMGRLVPGDTSFHYHWVESFGHELRQGALYPRWLSGQNHGLGDPTFVHYAPVYAYAVQAGRAAGLSTWHAMLATELISLASMGVAAFLVLRPRRNTREALLGAMVFEANPLLLSFVLLRGNRPGFVAACLFAWVLWALVQHDSRGRINWRAALALTLVTYTHVLTGFMASVCIPFFGLGAPRGERLRSTFALAATTALSAGLAAVYLVPAISGLSLIRPHLWAPAGLDWRRYFVLPIISGHFQPAGWPFFQYGMGLLVLGLVIIAVWTWWPRLNSGGLVFVSLSAFALASDAAYPLWAVLPGLRMVQFPYRFLSIAAPTAMLALLIISTSGWRGIVRLGALALCVALCGYVGLKGYLEGDSTSEFVAKLNNEPSVSAPEYLPNVARPDYVRYIEEGGFDAECRRLGVHCDVIEKNSQRQRYRFESEAPIRVRIPLFAYPHWRVEDADVDPLTGLFVVSLPAGAHIVEARWLGAPNQSVGLAITLGSLILLVLLCFRRMSPR